MADVPNVPGVPALPSYAANTVALLAADVGAVLAVLSGPGWGVFLNGAQAFAYRSIVDFDFKQDWPVSDYPVEPASGTSPGGFQSYDKVQLPFDVRVRMTSDGDEAGREALIADVQAGANTLNLYDVVTPEQTYAGCNITHVDFKRSAENGVGMILIDVWFLQIRQTSTSTFTSTRTPTVAGQQNTGSVATQAPSGQVDAGFDSGALVLR